MLYRTPVSRASHRVTALKTAMMAPGMPPLERSSLREQAVRHLRTSIVTGELEEDHFYSVGEFADHFGVSATPVRDAVGELASHGLIKIVPNRGFIVPRLTEADLEEIHELRIMLEVPAIEAIAGKLAPTYAAQCQALVEKGALASKAHDLLGFLESDRDFHLTLIRGHGNQRLVEIVERLRDQTRLYALPGLAASGRLAAAVDEHAAILAAVMGGERGLARENLVRHLHHTRGLWAGLDDPTSPA
jgi:DNA-binding GntR family transcriptional regulator